MSQQNFDWCSEFCSSSFLYFNRISALFDYASHSFSSENLMYKSLSISGFLQCEWMHVINWREGVSKTSRAELPTVTGCKIG